MNKDELAQWLVDYLHLHFQIHDVHGQRAAGPYPLQITTNWDGMATALLKAMKPTSEVCWCICHDEAPVPAEAEAIPVGYGADRIPDMSVPSAYTPPADWVSPKGTVGIMMVIWDTCPFCEGRWRGRLCGRCAGKGRIERFIPFHQLMELYWAGAKAEVEDQIKKGGV